jgi:hypothetical protein
MDPVLILGIISLIIEKGVPAYLEWQDGMKLENPTVEDIENLKVKKISEKMEE